MRILLDCRMATWTGVGRYTVGLTRALAALGDPDLELVCAVARKQEAPVPGLATVDANYSPLSPLGMLELGSIHSAVAPEVTHCLHFPTPFPVHRPLVVTMHDLTPLVIEGVMPSGLKRAIYRGLTQRAAARADLIVTLSQFTAAEVSRHIRGTGQRMRVTGAGADDFSAGPVASLSGQLARLAAGPYVLSMGSTRAHKDLPTLLRAFAPIALAHPELRLLLVGASTPGYLAATLPDVPEAVRERVTFTGRVSDDELRALYAGAAVFAFPSRYEGFGLPPLEAMALGAPVVCANAASLPEVVGEAALTFEPGDAAALAAAITRVLDEDAIRDGLVTAGRARAAELTWEAAARKTLEVYREAQAGPAG